MAHSKPLHSVLEEELECGICLDKLKNPRLLTCHHSFCENCLDGCTNDSATEGHTVMCPICRYTTIIPKAGVSGLRHDFRASKFLKALEEEQKRKDKMGSMGSKCSLCDASEASDFCVECDQSMCAVCSQFHMKMPVCRDHTLYPLHEVLSGKSRVVMPETSTSQCSKHNEQLKFYCKTCNTPICADCTVLDHSKADGHACVYLKEVMPQLRRDLQEFVAQVRVKEGELEAFLTDIDIMNETLRARCDLVNKRVTEAVAKIADTLHEKSNLFQETTQGNLHDIREESDSNRKAVGNVLTVLNQVNSSKDDVEVAGLYDSLRESVQSVVNKQLNKEGLDLVQSAAQTFDLRIVQDDAFVHPNLKLVHGTRSVTILDIPNDTEIYSMSLGRVNEILVTQKYRDEVFTLKRIQKCEQPQRITGQMVPAQSSRMPDRRIAGAPVMVQEHEGPSYTFSESKLFTPSTIAHRTLGRTMSPSMHASSLPNVCTTFAYGQVCYILGTMLFRTNRGGYAELHLTQGDRVADLAHDSSNNVYVVPEIKGGRQLQIHVVAFERNATSYISTGNILPSRVAACRDSPGSILVAQLQPATVARISKGGKILCSIKEPDGSSWEKVAIASDHSDNVYVLSSVNSMSTLRVFNEHGQLLETIFTNRPEPSITTTASNPPTTGKHPGSRLSMAVLPDGSTIAAYTGGQKILVITRDETHVNP